MDPSSDQQPEQAELLELYGTVIEESGYYGPPRKTKERPPDKATRVPLSKKCKLDLKRKHLQAVVPEALSADCYPLRIQLQIDEQLLPEVYNCTIRKHINNRTTCISYRLQGANIYNNLRGLFMRGLKYSAQLDVVLLVASASQPFDLEYSSEDATVPFRGAAALAASTAALRAPNGPADDDDADGGNDKGVEAEEWMQRQGLSQCFPSCTDDSMHPGQMGLPMAFGDGNGLEALQLHMHMQLQAAVQAQALQQGAEAGGPSAAEPPEPPPKKRGRPPKKRPPPEGDSALQQQQLEQQLQALGTFGDAGQRPQLGRDGLEPGMLESMMGRVYRQGLHAGSAAGRLDGLCQVAQQQLELPGQGYAQLNSCQATQQLNAVLQQNQGEHFMNAGLQVDFKDEHEDVGMGQAMMQVEPQEAHGQHGLAALPSLSPVRAQALALLQAGRERQEQVVLGNVQCLDIIEGQEASGSQGEADDQDASEAEELTHRQRKRARGQAAQATQTVQAAQAVHGPQAQAVQASAEVHVRGQAQVQAQVQAPVQAQMLAQVQMQAGADPMAAAGLTSAAALHAAGHDVLQLPMSRSTGGLEVEVDLGTLSLQLQQQQMLLGKHAQYQKLAQLQAQARAQQAQQVQQAAQIRQLEALHLEQLQQAQVQAHLQAQVQAQSARTQQLLQLAHGQLNRSLLTTRARPTAVLQLNSNGQLSCSLSHSMTDSSDLLPASGLTSGLHAASLCNADGPRALVTLNDEHGDPVICAAGQNTLAALAGPTHAGARMGVIMGQGMALNGAGGRGSLSLPAGPSALQLGSSAGGYVTLYQLDPEGWAELLPTMASTASNTTANTVRTNPTAAATLLAPSLRELLAPGSAVQVHVPLGWASGSSAALLSQQQGEDDQAMDAYLKLLSNSLASDAAATERVAAGLGAVSGTSVAGRTLLQTSRGQLQTSSLLHPSVSNVAVAGVGLGGMPGQATLLQELGGSGAGSLQHQVGRLFASNSSNFCLSSQPRAAALQGRLQQRLTVRQPTLQLPHTLQTRTVGIGSLAEWPGSSHSGGSMHVSLNTLNALEAASLGLRPMGQSGMLGLQVSQMPVHTLGGLSAAALQLGLNLEE